MSANCSVRFDLRATITQAYADRAIMHCHILEHEDQGVVGGVDVLGSGVIPAPTFPAGYGYSANYALSGPSCGDGTCNGTEDRRSCAADWRAPL